MTDEIARRPGGSAIGRVDSGNSLFRRGLQMLKAHKGASVALGDDEGWRLVAQLGHSACCRDIAQMETAHRSAEAQGENIVDLLRDQLLSDIATKSRLLAEQGLVPVGFQRLGKM